MKTDVRVRRFSPQWWDHQWFFNVNLLRTVKEMVARHAKPAKGQLVVDMGCGTKPYEPLFRERGCNYLGCDIAGDVDILIHPGEPISLADACADGVVSFQVLEHVWEIDWYLHECHRLLKPGGWFLLSTHFAWLYHPCPGDFRRWSRDGLERELQQRGFRCEAIKPVLGPLAWTTFFRLLGFQEILRKIPFLGKLILLPLISLMNIRMIIEDFITPAKFIENHASTYVILSIK